MILRRRGFTVRRSLRAVPEATGRSTALDENERVVNLFCDNLTRYLAGTPLGNVFERARGY